MRRHNLKTVITSKEDILSVSKKYILENGMSSFQIRAIAKECGISIGTVYNYFQSKSQLLIATIESVWIEIFEPLEQMVSNDCFIEAIQCMYDTIQNGNIKYPGFFSIHSLNFAADDKPDGILMMNSYFAKLKSMLLQVLQSDKHVKKEIFDDILTQEKFIDYIFTLFISSLLNKEESMSFIAFISNYIYDSH